MSTGLMDAAAPSFPRTEATGKTEQRRRKIGWNLIVEAGEMQRERRRLIAVCSAAPWRNH